MGLALVQSRALLGLQAPAVTVEVHLANGLPSFTLVAAALILRPVVSESWPVYPALAVPATVVAEMPATGEPRMTRGTSPQASTELRPTALRRWRCPCPRPTATCEA